VQPDAVGSAFSLQFSCWLDPVFCVGLRKLPGKRHLLKANPQPLTPLARHAADVALCLSVLQTALEHYGLVATAVDLDVDMPLCAICPPNGGWPA